MLVMLCTWIDDNSDIPSILQFILFHIIGQVIQSNMEFKLKDLGWRNDPQKLYQILWVISIILTPPGPCLTEDVAW